MKPYFAALCKAMEELSKRNDVEFLGQGVAYPGTTMTETLKDVPRSKLKEAPVAEDFQMGAAIGMALGGILPVCMFPRWNFLLCAANQLVNHLDRLPLYSAGRYQPKVIIRVAVPSIVPINAGPQHDDDFTEAFRLMLRTVDVVTLKTDTEVIAGYRAAADGDRSTLLVEYTKLYR